MMSAGRTVDCLPSTVVRVVTRGGEIGYGEACPLGATYLPAFGAGARVALAHLAPALLGVPAVNLAAVSERMDATLRGHAYAKSAIDIACWDILGKLTELPVVALLGGQLQSELPLYVAVPMATPDEMVYFVEREKNLGMHRFQLKLGAEPEVDVARIVAILGATTAEDTIVGDANGGWNRQDATIVVRQVERMDRILLEQPCATLEECLAIRKLTTLPMVLDEVIPDLATLSRAVSMDAMDHLNLKLGRVGGLSKARVMRDAAVELGIRLTIEDTWGGDLTTAAVSQLAAGTPPESLFAISYMNDWTKEHIAGYEPRSHRGVGAVPAGPGLGIEVDEDRLGSPLYSASE
ncbi:MAG: mandelate racemase/muconate lactonizing enzyme family protein [Candidatus Dormibacteria bacterium]